MPEAGLWRTWKRDTVTGKLVPVTEKDWETTTVSGGQITRTFKPEALALHPTLASTHGIFQIENLDQMSIFWILMLYMAKHGEVGAVKEIILKMFDGAFGSLKHYMAQAGDNRITAWGAGRMISLVFERFGLISQIQAMDFASGNNIVTGFEVGKQFLSEVGGIIGSLVPWNFGTTEKDDGFPDQKTTVINEKPDREEGGRSITLEKKES